MIDPILYHGYVNRGGAGPPPPVAKTCETNMKELLRKTFPKVFRRCFVTDSKVTGPGGRIFP